MERKIGEIFEHKGEWYQCIEHFHSIYKPDTNIIRDIPCFSCYFSCKPSLCGKNTLVGECRQSRRSDKREVCFKKLKKFGKLYEHNGKTYQLYKLPIPVDTTSSNLIYKTVRYDIIEVEIKQNQEDMEEKIQHYDCFFDKKEPNLKPFDIEAAKQGKSVCTRDGRKARIICFDAINPLYPLIVLVDNEGIETPFQYTKDGLKSHGVGGKCSDLMIESEKHEGWVNVYRVANSYESGSIYSTKEDAINERNSVGYVATVKIEWKE